LIYAFEDYQLDVGRRELRCRTGVIPVEPGVFDLLHYLIRHRERVVSKDELIAAVWNGRIVSESTLGGRINAARSALGDTGKEQRLIKTLPRKGFRFIGEAHEEGSPVYHAQQSVIFCRTSDRVNLAASSVGRGPVLVRAAHWATHIDYDWNSPITGPLLQRLAQRVRLVRYDGRGAGLSDRNIENISFGTMCADLEAVIDCFRLDRFALLGISHGAATAIAYAVQHPENVSGLVLFGGYALGRNKRLSPREEEEGKALSTLVRSGWSNHDTFFMRAFCSFFLPGASTEDVKAFVDFQRTVTDAENGVRLRTAVDEIDVLDLLHKIAVPTIVFHCVADNFVPFEQGRRLGASIPNSKFVALESSNHALLSSEPAWAKFVSETEAFRAFQARSCRDRQSRSGNQNGRRHHAVNAGLE